MVWKYRRRSRRMIFWSCIVAGVLPLIAFVVLMPLSAVPQNAPLSNCILGTPDAPIRLEVFSDFQCPACRMFYLETVTRLIKEYSSSGKVCLIYHEYPMGEYKYSRQAARYSLAAQRIGRKQWLAVVDALYKKQLQWGRDGRIDQALIGTVSTEDLIRIKSVAQEPYIKEALDRELALGDRRDVQKTPTIFWTALNSGPQKIDQEILPYDIWKRNIDRVLK